jgi:hypothetical protein
MTIASHCYLMSGVYKYIKNFWQIVEKNYGKFYSLAFPFA